MKVFTFGWDYPPVKNGGLGVACMGLTKELLELGIEVVFVLPRSQVIESSGRFIFADIGRARLREVLSPLLPYRSSRSLLVGYAPDGTRRLHAHHLIEEVYRYAQIAGKIALEEECDLIHAHDWTSYLAGLAAKRATGRPLILHVHATSFDQAGSTNVDSEIYAIERQAFHGADEIVAVSDYTKGIVVRYYGVAPEKVSVVHNGCDVIDPVRLSPVLAELKRAGKKIVLFHGRITIQKGPDYFIRAARRVVDVDPNVLFVISGWGDMEHEMMQLVGSLGLSSHVMFAGALWGEERDRMYQSADLVVMPSVSEPFGLVPLESIAHGTPVLISKQSGVSEVLTHALKVDFWDVEEMANKILAALRYDALHQQLARESRHELRRLSWRCAAEKVVGVYQRLAAQFTNRQNTDGSV